MKTILQILESPDKKHRLILERKYSLFDAACGEIHDTFYLKIKNNSGFLGRIFSSKRVHIGESHYCYDGSSSKGSVIGDINIKPENKFAEVILKAFVLNNCDNSKINTSTRIEY